MGKAPERVLLKQIDRNQRLLHQLGHDLAERLHTLFDGTLILRAEDRADDKPKLVFRALEVGRKPWRKVGQDGAGKEAHHAIHPVRHAEARDEDLVRERVAGKEVERPDTAEIAQRSRRRVLRRRRFRSYCGYLGRHGFPLYPYCLWHFALSTGQNARVITRTYRRQLSIIRSYARSPAPPAHRPRARHAARQDRRGASRKHDNLPV